MKKILFIFMVLPFLAHGEPMGRLFFTPEERAMLDRLRPGQLLLKGAGSGEGGMAGSVELKGGGRTVWVDGISRHLEPEQKK